MWIGIRPDLRHLKVFGTSVMVYVPKVKRRKFHPKAIKGVFLAYCKDTKGFWVYVPESHKVRDQP